MKPYKTPLAVVTMLSLLLLGPSPLSSEPRFVRIEDPVAQAMESAADGHLAEALAALVKEAKGSPDDAEAWASLAVLYQASGSKTNARRAGKHVLKVDPRHGRELLEASSLAFEKRCTEIHAEKEARGEIPFAVVTPWPTPDPTLWQSLEKERELAQLKSSLASPIELREGPRLESKAASKK